MIIQFLISSCPNFPLNTNLNNINIFSDFSEELYDFTITNTSHKIWTATENCVLFGMAAVNNSTVSIIINGIKVEIVKPDAVLRVPVYIPVKKGSEIEIYQNEAGTNKYVKIKAYKIN